MSQTSQERSRPERDAHEVEMQTWPWPVVDNRNRNNQLGYEMSFVVWGRLCLFAGRIVHGGLGDVLH